MGDFAVPCFPLAKVLRQPPAAIAAKLAEHITAGPVIASAHAEGGFLNIRLDRGQLARTVIGEALRGSRSERGFGAGHASETHRFLVEFSSPNTNKPLHLGHVRNNVLGLAVGRMLSHAGHAVHSVSLVNDRGVHICKTILAYMKWGDGKTPESEGVKGDHLVGDLYVAFAAHFGAEYASWLESPAGQATFEQWRTDKQARAAERKRRGKTKKPDVSMNAFAKSFEDTYFNQHSELGAETRDLLRRWEHEDEDVRALWRTMNQWVFDGFDAT